MGKKQQLLGDGGFGRATSVDESDWQKKLVQELYECPEHKSKLHASPAKTELRELLKSKVSDINSLLTFRSFMCDFEKRKQTNNLSSEEVDKTYQQLSRLLDKRGTGYTTEDSRLALAKQILENAAFPSPIFQGAHNTCAPAAIESRMYTRNPSDAARLVTDIALTGKFTTTDGNTIQVPAINLHQDPDSGMEQVRDGVRPYASQVFQSTIGNLYWQSHVADPNSVRYVQMPHAPESTGELLQYKRGKQWITRTDEPLLYDNTYRDIYEKIVGKTKTNGCFVIEPPNPSLDDGISTVKAASASQLGKTLQAMREQFPIITAVHTSNEPFYSDNYKRNPSWHAITVTEMDANGYVTIPNSWTLGSIRKMHYSQLYKCMIPREQQDKH
jgi:hypothetical protein